MGYLEQAIERLKQFEGSVPWMYLDTVGKVTVGVGSMLPDARAAGLLPFVLGERAATADEIAKEFGRVCALAKGRAAAFYRKEGGLRLAEKAIDERLSEVLEGFEGYLRTHLGGYDGLPDGAKLALLDMVYNLGPGRLFQEYPKLLAAIAKGDWSKAAGACLRRGPGAARNVWTKEQFLAAAKRISVQAEAAMEESSSSSESFWGWVPVLLGAGAALLAILAVSARGVPSRSRAQP